MTAPHRPPPCAQECWEWIPTRGHGTPNTWTFTRSARHCGHYFDDHTRQWKWLPKAERGTR